MNEINKLLNGVSLEDVSSLSSNARVLIVDRTRNADKILCETNLLSLLNSNMRFGSQVATGGVATITFTTPYTDANWQFVGIPYVDYNGLRIGAFLDVSNKTATGFTADFSGFVATDILYYCTIHF